MITWSLSLLRQYTAAAVASISVIILGTSLGWPSPVLLEMKNTGEPFSMADEEISWMVSLLYIGNLVSPLPSGYLMDRFGRKRSLLVLAVIPMSSWILIYFAQNALMLYIARFLSGTWSGIVSTIVTMYLAEISVPQIRGALSTFVQMMTNMGVLAEYVIGPMVCYETLAIISGSLPVLFILSFSMMPESPYWLLMVGKKEEAAKSLVWLRALPNVASAKEEVERLDQAVQQEMQNKKTFKDLVATKGNRKALLMVEFLAVAQRMSGVSALMAYSSTTLPSAGAGSLSINECVVVIGSVWVVSVFIATVLVDSLGRKPLLLMSSIGCGLAMFSAGLWFFLDQKTDIDVSEYYYVPFAAFIVYGLFFSFGLGPVASTVQGEAFPTNTKGLASGITAVFLALTSFVMNKIYHPIDHHVGMFLNYWIFCGACVAAGIFVMTGMVETKGKSLHEIQEKLNRSKKAKSLQKEGA